MTSPLFVRRCGIRPRDAEPEAAEPCDQACGGWGEELGDEIAEIFGELSQSFDMRDRWSGFQLSRKKTVRVRDRRTGRPMGRPPGTGKNTERAQALELLDRGLSMRRVAMRLGVHWTTVRRWRDAHRVERKAA